MDKNSRERYETRSEMLLSTNATIGMFELSNIFFRSTFEANPINIREHAHPSLHELAIMKRGSMVYGIDGERIEITAAESDMVFIPAGFTHTRLCREAGSEVVGFQFELAERSRAAFKNESFIEAIKSIGYYSKSTTEVRRNLSLLYGELKSKRALTMIMRELKIKILLVAMLRASIPDLFMEERASLEVSPERQMFLLIDKYIDDHLDEKILPAELARMCHYSLRHLNRIFLKKLDINPGKYITLRKMTYARNQLAGSSKSIKEISLDIGYQTTSHFCRCFKELFATTPGEYRRRFDEKCRIHESSFSSR